MIFNGAQENEVTNHKRLWIEWWWILFCSLMLKSVEGGGGPTAHLLSLLKGNWATNADIWCMYKSISGFSFAMPDIYSDKFNPITTTNSHTHTKSMLKWMGVWTNAMRLAALSRWFQQLILPISTSLIRQYHHEKKGLDAGTHSFILVHVSFTISPHTFPRHAEQEIIAVDVKKCTVISVPTPQAPAVLHHCCFSLSLPPLSLISIEECTEYYRCPFAHRHICVTLCIDEDVEWNIRSCRLRKDMHPACPSTKHNRKCVFDLGDLLQNTFKLNIMKSCLRICRMLSHLPRRALKMSEI